MAGLTALGHDWQTISNNLRARHSGVRYMKEWDRYKDLNTRLAAPVASFELPLQYNRKIMRSMGPVALMSTRATELALEDAGLLNDPMAWLPDVHALLVGMMRPVMPK